VFEGVYKRLKPLIFHADTLRGASKESFTGAGAYALRSQDGHPE
jgi:hypothetical protein